MPSWITPTAVHSRCGEMVPGGEATNAIDDDTATYWRHNNTCYHWIILDLGQTDTVSKVRLYQSGIASRRWGKTDGLDVFVSDNPANFGSAVWTGALDATGWQESGAFSKNGRYVKLVSKSNSELQLLNEFDAYCVTSKTGSDSGVGAESLGARILSAVDTGSGADALVLLVSNIHRDDTGAGADIVSAHINVLQKNDTGVGAEVLGTELFSELLATVVKSDQGAGAELLGSRLFLAADQGAGADALLELIATTLKSDQGAGADALLELIATTLKSDQGAGADALITLLGIITQSDVGSGIDAIGSRALDAAEIGTGVDSWSQLLATLTCSDSGAGAESTLWIITFILLKLLHERQVNIMVSQSERPVNLTLQEAVIS